LERRSHLLRSRLTAHTLLARKAAQLRPSDWFGKLLHLLGGPRHPYCLTRLLRTRLTAHNARGIISKIPRHPCCLTRLLPRLTAHTLTAHTLMRQKILVRLLRTRLTAHARLARLAFAACCGLLPRLARLPRLAFAACCGLAAPYCTHIKSPSSSAR
jgi:hypothetical protein